MSRWTVKVGSWKGVPIYVHASLALGLVLYGGFSVTRWLTLAGVILLHELGHAAVVRAVGARATEVMLHALGGHCRWKGDVTPLGRAAIASGGVAAQLAVLVPLLVLDRLGVVPWEFRDSPVWDALTVTNAFIIAFNLLPISPLDGGEAWRLPLLLGRRARRRRQRTATVPEHDARAVAAQLLEEARRGDD